MSERERIDNKYSREIAQEMVRAYNKAYQRIIKLSLDDMKDADLVNSIIEEEYKNTLLKNTNLSYDASKQQYENAIRTLQASFRRDTNSTDFKYRYNIDDKNMLDILDKQNSLFLTKYYDENLSDKVIEKLKEDVLNKQSKKEIANSIADILQWTGKKGHQSAYNLVVTNNTWVRSVASVTMMETAGVTKYRYLVTLDNVTSPICRALYGKEVEVKSGIKLRDDYLAIPRNDYNEFEKKSNELSPMLSYDEEKKVFYRSQDNKNSFKREWKESDVMSIPGIQLPPYHFQCRTELSIIL
jgi:hypothetical protein